MAENTIPVSREAHESNVRELQGYLREIHYSGRDIRRVTPDGIYSDNTAGAVEDMQRLSGLPQTGETDLPTWNAVYGAYREVSESNPHGQGIQAFPQKDAVISGGDSGTSVIILQAMLNTLAGEYVNIPPNSMSGYYDSNTAKAVAAVQELSGLTPTGKTDLAAWNNIVRLFNGAVEGE